MYNFVWNRWYINEFYIKVFAEPSVKLAGFAQRYIENPLNIAVNGGIPEGFKKLSTLFKKIQTGRLRVNMVYFLVLLVIVLILLWLGGFF
jgi:NADH:ubiquinone oxidoreductase subunit 5 (subunit L)/multisubunit Na+/H+ antiporter MnhA subunit